MSRVLRSQVRRLPWDVLFVVFQECDDATLAVLGRVSLDFLQSTANILYEHVEVDSQRSLELLFCKRTSSKKQAKSPVVSRIEPFLSLVQAKSLRVDFSTKLTVDLNGLSFSRIAQTDPLPLDLLHLSTRKDRHIYITVLSDLHTTLLPHLNPTRLEYRDHTEEKDTPYQPLHSAPLLQNWTRLEVIDLQGTFPYRMGNFEGGLRLAALPPPTLARRRTLRFHLASLLTTLFPSPFALLSYILEDRNLERFGLDAMQKGAVVLVVRSEEEKEEARKVVQTLEERWRSLFTIILEP